jgi:cytochrome c biogenesis protein CcdA
MGAFFAPCAFALFPAYISYYLTSAGTGPEGVGRSLALGASCAAGSTLFFALAGAGITLVGGAISPYLIATKPIIALAVALLGLGLVADVRLPSPRMPIGAVGARLPAGAGLFVYGFAYSLASTGCTLPIYVSITVLPVTTGFAGAAALTFASFAAAMALMMVLTSLLVGLARASLLRRLQAAAASRCRVSRHDTGDTLARTVGFGKRFPVQALDELDVDDAPVAHRHFETTRPLFFQACEHAEEEDRLPGVETPGQAVTRIRRVLLPLHQSHNRQGRKPIPPRASGIGRGGCGFLRVRSESGRSVG